MAPMEYASPPPIETPQLANTVIITCSFMLNGPGFRLKLRPNNRYSFVGKVAAMNFPIGKTAICMRMAEMVSGWVRYMKKVFRKIKTVHEATPSVHARNVSTGSDGSSVSGTTSATSSTVHSGGKGWPFCLWSASAFEAIIYVERRK